MSGRNVFEKYQRVIALLSNVFNFLPRFLLDFVANLFISSESKSALLFRYLYLRKYAKSIGNNVYIGSHCVLKNLEGLSIGNNVSIHAFCYIDSAGGIEIGNDVSIANSTSIISFDHTWANKNLPIKYNQVEMKPIKIENDVWVGNGVRILGGVTIHSRSIVAAGAVVNKNIQSNVIAGGVPVKNLKEI